MACYCDEYVYYRGRKIRVSYRYCEIMSLSVAKGRYLYIRARDKKKIIALALRKAQPGPCPLSDFDDNY